MTNSSEKPRRNPYIIGRPVEDRNYFFGRESLFRFIEDNLRGNVKVILLHGQRRIGKSSLLKQISHFFDQLPENNFIFVNFDLQDKASHPLSQVLYLLAREIYEHLVDHLSLIPYGRLTLPSDVGLEIDSNIFSRDFLSQVYQELGNKKLVLLLDEFDVLSDTPSNYSAGQHFFPYLQRLINQHSKLFIIPVIGRNLDDLPNLLSLFSGAPNLEIGLLEDISARRLITRPSQDMLEYEHNAIEAILKLSAGHPYFTQIICNALFREAKSRNNSKITRTDVESITDQAIENAEGGLDWFWKGLPTPEQVVFSAVAEAQRIAILENKPVPEEPLKLLKNYGVKTTDYLVHTAHLLADKGFLDKTERMVKIELVRRWLVQRHPLRQEILQLENLQQEEIAELREAASREDQQGNQERAKILYERILDINPNHFSSITHLAQIHLQNENCEESVELYRRAYQADRIRNQEGYLRALQAFGEKLITQKAWTVAKEQFSQVLEIEPDNQAAQGKLEEIERTLLGKVTADSRNLFRQKRILFGGVAAGIIALVSFGTYRLVTPCYAGHQKIFGVYCALDQRKISHGERTFFPKNQNQERDKGIEAFQQGNYPKAIQHFKKAVGDKYKDPEVQIYYNNALAKQKGISPFKLAVVIPANTQDIAQEMLRGVAQAQSEYNQKQGSNDRLLEIAIANDNDDPSTAEQVAQELINVSNDSPILGVIGHYSSDSTKAALKKYRLSSLAIISPTSTSTELTGEVFFRTVPSDTSTGKILAEYARNLLRLNKVVILYNPNSPYSRSITVAFTTEFRQLGGNPPVMTELTDQSVNIEHQVKNTVSQEEAQAIVFFPDTQHISETIRVAQAITNSNVPGLKLLGGSSLYSQESLIKGGKAVEGLILAVPWFKDAPQSKIFAGKAAKEWGGDISWRTATSYDAAKAFIDVIFPEASRSTILRDLPNTNLSPNETSGDVLQFSKRNRQNQPILVRVEGGKFIYLK